MYIKPGNADACYWLLLILLVGAPVLAQVPDPTVPVNANSQWTPAEQVFDGVPMVLVPAGCFQMGFENPSSNSSNYEPAHEVCFEQPFWIDKTEATQADFARLGGDPRLEMIYVGDDLPANNVNWFQARDFCAERGAQLPSEAEWEYAARGPDSLLYPWGDEYGGMFEDRELAQQSPRGLGLSAEVVTVGSFPAGASWVGALDMSGNVKEWTRSFNFPYPYDATDGREQDEMPTPETSDTEPVPSFPGSTAPEDQRILRGEFTSSSDSSTNYAHFRFSRAPTEVLPGFGFRCIRPYSPGDVQVVDVGPRNTDWTPDEQDFDGFTMVRVPAGCFPMGYEFRFEAPKNRPVHEVCFDEPYWIDKTEVTYQDFERLDGVKARPRSEDIHTNDAPPPSDNHPVIGITVFEARTFCQARGGDLPTEAEWEYAARGPEGASYPYGFQWDPALSSHYDTFDKLIPVGVLPNNASWVGALDIAGNAAEWTRSVMLPYPYTDAPRRNLTDERDAGSFRQQFGREGVIVQRGGSFRDGENRQHSAYREEASPGATVPSYLDETGFRCVIFD